MALPPEAPPPTPLRILSTFSGIAGLDLGVQRACGGRVVCYVERETYAAATLVARMEDQTLCQAPVWSDITSFDGKPWRGAVDLVIGGFPCTDISTAGKRAGIEGEKSGLFFELARIIDEVRPRYLFMENVGAILVRGIDRVLGTLSELGYDVSWGVFSAQEVGAPQIRKRWFALGVDQEQGGRHPALEDPNYQRERRIQGVQGVSRGWRNQPEGAEQGLADAAGSGSSGGNGPREGSPEPSQELADALRVREQQRPERERVLDQRPEDGEGVADPSLERLQGLRLPREEESPTPAGTVREGSYIRDIQHAPDASSIGRRVESERDQLRSPIGWNPNPRNGSKEGPSTFPPGPDDAEGWRAVLEQYPELTPAIDSKPELRGVASGVPLWVEQAHLYRPQALRALGNAVVPQCAEFAFRELWGRLDHS